MGRKFLKTTLLFGTLFCTLHAPSLSTNWKDFTDHNVELVQGKKPQQNSNSSSESSHEHRNRSALAIVRRCDEVELQRIKASPFLATPDALHAESKCPDSLWLNDMINLDYTFSNSDTKRLLLSVGCNTALDIVRTAHDISHNPIFNAQTWKETMQNVTSRFIRPICPSAPQRNITSDDAPKTLPIEIHCIEPIDSTINAIQETTKRLGLDQHGFLAHQYVVSNSTGVIPFPLGLAGIEHMSSQFCGQLLHPGRKHSRRIRCHDVPMLTLDDFATQHVQWHNKSDRTVDVLTIDTEGFDWRVLRGARSVVARTRYLEFEYHEVWGQGDLLKDAVDYLEELGFVCYFAGRDGRLFKLTHGCWVNELYEVRVWSNVACVHRSESAWLGIMEDYYQKTLLITT